jgi:hypothetical protein
MTPDRLAHLAAAIADGRVRIGQPGDSERGYDDEEPQETT